MSLAELIIKVRHNLELPANLFKIEEILKSNPETVENLQRKTATKLIRHATRLQHCLFNEQVTILTNQFNINANPLDLALFRGNLQLIESLLKNGAKLDGPEWVDFSPANYVFFNNNSKVYKDMILLLVKYGFNPDLPNECGENCLHLLTKNVTEEDSNNIETAEILIKAGVSINKTDMYQVTPLQNCIMKKNFKLLSFLVERGADVNQRSAHNWTPLYMAVVMRCEDFVCQFLLSKGADIDAKNDVGQTSLHVACVTFNFKLISLLIKRGADITVEDKNGKTPFTSLRTPIRNFDEDIFYVCSNILIKKISILSFQNIPVSSKDLECIRNDARYREYFEKCVTELNLMTKTKFYAIYTYYWVLKMQSKNNRKLANLTKNREFLAKFEENLGSFPSYQRTYVKS